MAESAKTITDHNPFASGSKATVKGTEKGGDEVGLLRINFPGGAKDKLEDISWDEFFEKFESRDDK